MQSSGLFSLKSLEEIIECPVCLGFPEKPLFRQCSNGHSGCWKCFSRLKFCPLCRTSLQWRIRSSVAEQIMKNIFKLRQTDETTIELEDMSKVIQCTGCNFLPTRGPVLQCRSGSIVCIGCFDSTRLCPRCYGITLNHVRSLLCEKLLALISKPCRFAINGCNSLIKELDNHESVCVYRNVQCVQIYCFASVPMCKLGDHLSDKNQHLKCSPIIQATEFGNINKSSLHFENKSTSRTVHLTLNSNDHFFMECLACRYDKKCFFWVFFIGSKTEAEKFTYKLTLYLDGNPSPKISVSGPVVSIDVSRFGLRESKHTFSLSFEDIRKLWNQEAVHLSWEVSVSVKST